ncbi:hypothetical protein NE237_022552 [Protea cynaroides]|uniref:Uncharacterized protein n=1 Tax=Protea cynaroides TaxID=273540 RepID=A0A9Q0K5X8_9MAGN|nr:hypothetical protein NE237_022552 [Protea cynaroides]
MAKETFKAAGRVPQEGHLGASKGLGEDVLTEDTPREGAVPAGAATNVPGVIGAKGFVREVVLSLPLPRDADHLTALVEEEFERLPQWCTKKMRAETKRLKVAIDSEKELGAEYQSPVASKDTELVRLQRLRAALAAIETAKRQAKTNAHKAEAKAA